MTRKHLPILQWEAFGMTQVIGPMRETVGSILAKERNADNVIAAAAHASAIAEDAIKKSKEDYPPPRPIACKSGCAWCCYIKVVVTPAEVLRIKDYLAKNLSEDDVAALRVRTVAADAKTRGMTSLQRGEHHIPCPLLNDDRCSVYSVRPLSCIGHNSFDANECKKGYEHVVPDEDYDIELYGVQPDVASAVQKGLSSLLGMNGYDGSLLELNAALRIVLERANAGERYVQGRHVFAPARDPEAEADIPPEIRRRLRGQ